MRLVDRGVPLCLYFVKSGAQPACDTPVNGNARIDTRLDLVLVALSVASRFDQCGTWHVCPSFK